MARDLKRIKKILHTLEIIWKSSPDLRFFQLMSFIESVAKNKFKKDDLFYVEDDEAFDTLYDALAKLLEIGEEDG